MPKLSIFDIFDETPKQKPIRSKSKPKPLASQFDLFAVDPMSIPSCDIGTSDSSDLGYCPNKHPSISTSYRIAIIGESPGEDECTVGEPFVGQSGRFLDQCLSRANIIRNACFIGNVCQHRPPKNDLSLFSRDGEYITAGLTTLATDLASFDPNLCLLLGKTSLWAAKGTDKITDWKCSFFIGDKPGPFLGRKCIATFHPAFALRQYADGTPWITFALQKARQEASSKTLLLPSRDLRVDLSYAALCNELDRIILEKPKISIDIEGGVHSMSCCSIAPSPIYSFIVPFARMNGSNYWELDEELVIWDKFVTILSDASIPKVLQNALYDTFVLQYSYDVVVKGVVEDTMLKHWSLYCELEKALGVQVSIYCGTEPYYKFERKSDDEETFFKYCCKDSAVTLEIANKLEHYLDAGQLSHYHSKVASLNFFRYMMRRGIKYNHKLAKQRLVEMKDIVYGYQEKLDQIAREAGVINGLDYSQSSEGILSQVQERACHKKDKTRPKKGYEERGYSGIVKLIHGSVGRTLSTEEKGAISVLCKCTMNTKSKIFKDFLYGTCGLPIQHKKDLKTKELKPTTDYKSLLKLSKSHPHPVLNLALELSRLRTRAQMLAIQPDKDGRMRCSYNAVGSETERVTSSKSPIYVKGNKRVGANMQTIPDDWDLEDDEHPLTQGMRDLLLADDNCYLCKCDLKGADGWTIGAYLSMLGNPTMLDDLKAGLKPAQIVALNVITPNCTLRKSRPEIKAMIDQTSKDKWKEMWQYFVSKCLIWGYCYRLGPIKGAELVFIESEGKVNMDQPRIKEVFSAIETRYQPSLFHRYMENYAASQPYPAKLVAPNGFTRKFFGRNFGSKIEITGEMLAHLPQVITTYATNTAAHRLWTDPENRGTVGPVCNGRDSETCTGVLRVEPVHQVHDELLVQFKISDTSWALTKIKQWFDNPIIIAGQKITIPYDGSYGTNWAMDEHSKVGSL